MSFNLSSLFNIKLGTPTSIGNNINKQTITGTTKQNGSITGEYASQSGTKNQGFFANINNPNGTHKLGALSVEGVGAIGGATGSVTIGATGSTGTTGSTGSTGSTGDACAPEAASGWFGTANYGLAGIYNYGAAGAANINVSNNNGSSFNGGAAGITGIGGILGGYGKQSTSNGLANYGLAFIPGLGAGLAFGNQTSGNYGYLAGNGKGVSYYVNYNGQVYKA